MENNTAKDFNLESQIIVIKQQLCEIQNLIKDLNDEMLELSKKLNILEVRL